MTRLSFKLIYVCCKTLLSWLHVFLYDNHIHIGQTIYWQLLKIGAGSIWQVSVSRCDLPVCVCGCLVIPPRPLYKLLGESHCAQTQTD